MGEGKIIKGRRGIGRGAGRVRDGGGEKWVRGGEGTSTSRWMCFGDGDDGGEGGADGCAGSE